jgi:response regulator RpfG family c-di-GMP phosphodiesterase
VRVVAFAQDLIVLRAAHGDDAAFAKLKERKGSAYEPRIVDRFFRRAEEFTTGLDEATWETVLALEPGPCAEMSDEEFDAACLAMADIADLKSPYTAGHSRAVSALAGEAARRCGLTAADAVDLTRAGLLHDIGQVAVSARIWTKPGKLNASEWEQVRLHPYYGERVLARPPTLARLGRHCRSAPRAVRRFWLPSRSARVRPHRARTYPRSGRGVSGNDREPATSSGARC